MFPIREMRICKQSWATPHNWGRVSLSQSFRQMAQNSAGHADAWSRNYGTYDEQLCKRDVCIELCGVALDMPHTPAAFLVDCPNLDMINQFVHKGRIGTLFSLIYACLAFPLNLATPESDRQAHRLPGIAANGSKTTAGETQEAAQGT